MNRFSIATALAHKIVHGPQISKGTFNEVFMDGFMQRAGYDNLGKFCFQVGKRTTDLDRVYSKGSNIYVLDVKSNSVANNDGLTNKLDDARKEALYQFGEEVKLHYVFFKNEKGSDLGNESTMDRIRDKGFTPITFYDFCKVIGVDSDVEFEEWSKCLEDFLEKKTKEVGVEKINEFCSETGMTIPEAIQLLKDMVVEIENSMEC